MGSPMDITAEKLHLLIWQRHTSVLRGHQGITCPTSQQLAPHLGSWGARPDPFYLSQAVPGTSSWTGHPQPPPAYAGAPCPLPCPIRWPISAGSWVTAETRCILGFPMPCVNLLELAGPRRDPSLATVLPDASTPFIHPHTVAQERGEGGPPAAAPGGRGAPGVKLVFCFLPFDKPNCRS